MGRAFITALCVTGVMSLVYLMGKSATLGYIILKASDLAAFRVIFWVLLALGLAKHFLYKKKA